MQASEVKLCSRSMRRVSHAITSTSYTRRVVKKQEDGRVVAALSFSGIPLDWEVLAAERKLRGLLLVDGVQASDGYLLARYNEPFVLPPLKRNEVLIELTDQ